MKAIYIFLITVSAVFFLHSCSTDFDVIGEYEETTIIYGLLDQNEEYHYLRINKSFLGPGNAYDYAVVRDSSEYSQLSGVVEEWVSGIKIREWQIRDTVLSDREDGAFYSPEYTAYYFVESNLNEDAEYRLKLEVGESGKEVSAQTELVSDVSFHSQTSNAPVMGFHNGTSYGSYPIKFNNSENGKRFDVVLKLIWFEVSGTDTVTKYLDWFVGSEIVEDSKMDEPNTLTFEKVASGESFYQFIANSIEPDASVDKRIFKGIKIFVSAASTDLYTYTVLNTPSNGLVQERPHFTNVDGGIGIFSARTNTGLARKALNKNSLEFLCEGAVTGHLGFCSDTVIYSSESFYCN